MIDKRAYGKSGDRLSIIGLGGIVIARLPQQEANRIVHEAIERGINYFDVAPTYMDAEERLGPALQPFRDQVFLACKTTHREATAAQRELEESLVKLRTDHLDLYQLHGITGVDEIEQVFSPGGAMEAFVTAREQGKVRHLGLSAHSEEAALEAIRRFPFDSVLFPFNFVTLFSGNMGWELLAEAPKRGISLLALKSMARTKRSEGVKGSPKCWYEPISDPHLAELALRFALSLPVTAALPPGDENMWPGVVSMAERFSRITPEEERVLRAEAAKLEPIFSRR